MDLVVFLFIVSIVMTAVVTFYLFVNWGTHLAMVKDRNGMKIRISFNKFLELYSQSQWNRDEYFPKSHFSPDHYSGYIHADIVRIGDQEYFFGPIAFAQFKWWEMKNRLKVSNDMIW